MAPVTPKNPTRFAVPCSECKAPVAYVSSAQVVKAQNLTPWRGWGLAVVLSTASRMLSLKCNLCEAKDAPRPVESPAPTLL